MRQRSFARIAIHFILLSEEQFFLNRLANSAIDIYSMVCLLSRATRSLERGYASSQHEAMMTQVFCEEVGVLHFSIIIMFDLYTVNNYRPTGPVYTFFYDCFFHIIQASNRIAANLGALTCIRQKSNFEKMSSISKNMVEAGGLVQQHPLGF